MRVARRVAVAPSGNRAVPPAATTRRAVEGTREAVRTSVQHQAQASARTRAAPLGAAPKQPPWPAPSLVMREDCRTLICQMIVAKVV